MNGVWKDPEVIHILRQDVGIVIVHVVNVGQFLCMGEPWNGWNGIYFENSFRAEGEIP